MEPPPLVTYASPAEYRAHFEAAYCGGPIATFDGIMVRFRKHQFDHCFFESSRRDGSKDTFSTQRAVRIDWIRATLQSAEAELYQGWDSARKCHDPGRRVAIILGDYVVVIAITGASSADFVTAFVSAPAPPGRLSAAQRIRSGPRWKKENR